MYALKRIIIDINDEEQNKKNLNEVIKLSNRNSHLDKHFQISATSSHRQLLRVFHPQGQVVHHHGIRRWGRSFRHDKKIHCREKENR